MCLSRRRDISPAFAMNGFLGKLRGKFQLLKRLKNFLLLLESDRADLKLHCLKATGVSLKALSLVDRRLILTDFCLTASTRVQELLISIH